MSVLIEMVSDLVCPWCWLGMRRLNEAIAMIGDEFPVEVIYRPYQLDPTVPREGMPYKEYMAAKFGGAGDSEKSEQKDRFSAMRQMLEQYGEAEGIPFKFSGIEVRPNTLDAHRLLRWAQGQNLGYGMKEALFHAYFTDHRDIGDKDVLADIGASVGMDRNLLIDLLSRDADLENVMREEAAYRQMGISGVPTYIANRKVAVQGAEEAGKLARFLRTAANEYPLEAAQFS
mgnify:FL=1